MWVWARTVTCGADDVVPSWLQYEAARVYDWCADGHAAQWLELWSCCQCAVTGTDFVVEERRETVHYSSRTCRWWSLRHQRATPSRCDAMHACDTSRLWRLLWRPRRKAADCRTPHLRDQSCDLVGSELSATPIMWTLRVASTKKHQVRFVSVKLKPPHHCYGTVCEAIGTIVVSAASMEIRSWVSSGNWRQLRPNDSITSPIHHM